MTTTTTKIAAANTKDTGITEPFAEKLWPNLGKTFMAVVELSVDEHSEDLAGDRGVKLVINSIEPGAGENVDTHLRELQRALYFRRNPQPHLDDPDEQTVTDVLRHGSGLLAAGLRDGSITFSTISKENVEPIGDLR